jgi:O-antigen ligase
VLVLAGLFAAPWALGARIPAAYLPLLALCYLAGLISWARGHWARSHGHDVPPVPGTRLLLALHGLVLLQLVPLPPFLLRLVSPGSHSYHDLLALVPRLGWAPISVSPVDTARGLAFLAGVSLLYAFAYRELASPEWRRRAVVVIVANAALLTLAALVQLRSDDPRKILGFYKPEWDWAVFGPYVNKNHFAGYLALAIPLGLAWTHSAFRELRRVWRRRRHGWLALGDPAGLAWMRRAAVAAVLLAGLLLSRSRGGLMAVVVATVAAPLLLRRRVLAALGGALVLAAALLFVGTETLERDTARALEDSRFSVWPDALRMVPDFPVFGVGFNDFPSAYRRYQRVHLHEWVGEAHNDYLQALTDIGLLGLGLTLGLVALLVRTALRNAETGNVSVGLLGSVLASCTHALVDFNWQVPANAATFALLAGLAMQSPGHRLGRTVDPPSGDP